MANEATRLGTVWRLVLVVLISLPSGLSGTQAACNRNGWQLHSRLPEGRAAMIPLPGEEIRLMGGNFWHHDQKIFASDGFRWNDLLEVWERLDSRFPCPANATHASSGNFLHLHGGTPPVWIAYDAKNKVTVEWNTPSPRTYASSTVHTGNLWVIGGEQPDQLGDPCVTLVLDTHSGQLQRSLPSPTEKALINAFSLASAGSIQVLGGGCRTDDGIMNSGRIHEWNQTTTAWKTVGQMPKRLRGHMGIRLTSDAWFIGGGYDSDRQAFSEQAWLYYPLRQHWTRLPDLPEGIMLGSVFIHNGGIHVAGGEIAPKTRSDRVYVLPAEVVGRYLACSN